MDIWTEVDNRASYRTSTVRFMYYGSERNVDSLPFRLRIRPSLRLRNNVLLQSGGRRARDEPSTEMDLQARKAPEWAMAKGGVVTTGSHLHRGHSISLLASGRLT